MHFSTADLQTIQAGWLLYHHLTLDVLRLDKLHPVVSGNKWFKLQHYIKAAAAQCSPVATFGGAYSNHIVATAFACKEVGLKSMGIIRGEKPLLLSATLQSAMEFGMELLFVSREAYSDKVAIKNQFASQNFYWINEGGYGFLGAKGAAEIGVQYDLSAYTHIVAAVGTGTMLAGLTESAKLHQQIIGVSAMKGNESLTQQVKDLLSPQVAGHHFEILHDYHFGGFGKHPQSLVDFINETYEQHQLPLDIVYTGKVFYAIKDLIAQHYFAEGSNILMIHSGGLQGNGNVVPQRG